MALGLSRNRGSQERHGNDTQWARQPRQLSVHMRYMFQNNPLACSQCRISEWESPKTPCSFVRSCKHPKCFANTFAHMLKISAPSTRTQPQCHQWPTERGQLNQHATLNPVPTPSQYFHVMPLQTCSDVYTVPTQS